MNIKAGCIINTNALESSFNDLDKCCFVKCSLKMMTSLTSNCLSKIGGSLVINARLILSLLCFGTGSSILICCSAYSGLSMAYSQRCNYLHAALSS